VVGKSVLSQDERDKTRSSESISVLTQVRGGACGFEDVEICGGRRGEEAGGNGGRGREKGVLSNRTSVGCLRSWDADFCERLGTDDA